MISETLTAQGLAWPVQCVPVSGGCGQSRGCGPIVAMTIHVLGNLVLLILQKAIPKIHKNNNFTSDKRQKI